MMFRRSYCDPFRRAVPAACAGVDALLGANKAQMQAGEASYMAQVARNNQQVAQWNAQRALDQGQAQQDRQRQQTGLAIGQQRAALATQGGDVNSGSSLDLVGDTAREGELAAQTIGDESRSRAYRFLVDASNDAGQANLYDSRAINIGSSYRNDLIGTGIKTGIRVGASLLGLPPL